MVEVVKVHDVMLGENEMLDRSAVTIRISTARMVAIHEKTAGRITYITAQGNPPEDPLHVAQWAHLLSNSLMPDLMPRVLKEVLTTKQYERLVAAFEEGKPVKFQLSKPVAFRS